MKFRYLRDPLFLVCLAVYFANRWILKPHFANEFSRCYLNDLICLPFWIPIMLFIMRKIGLRKSDTPPSGLELVVPLLLWAWVFEIQLPRVGYFQNLATPDSIDILAYTAGALLAACFWSIWYRKRHSREAVVPPTQVCSRQSARGDHGLERAASLDISCLDGRTGDPPVSSGHWPDEREGARPGSIAAGCICALCLPSGGSPLGTGESPVLPLRV